MRDRLIELLRNAPKTDTVYGNIKLPEPVQTLQTIADHLLAAGVIVPPCKVGDYVKVKGDSKVWRVDALHFYREGVPDISISDKKVTNTMSFETFEECLKVLTREEAEEALGERSDSDG